MTLFVRQVRSAHRGAYWTAYMGSPASVAGWGRTRKEALGDLVELIATLRPGPVEVRDLPPVGDPPIGVMTGREVVTLATRGEGGAQ